MNYEDNEKPAEQDEVQTAEPEIGMPDIVIGLTPEGFVEGVKHVLIKGEFVSPETKIRGIIADVEFRGQDGTLPVGVYLDKANSKGLQ